MTIDLNIQFGGGKLIVTVGGVSAPNSSELGHIVAGNTVDAAAAAGNKGGAAPGTEPLTSGGAVPGSGVLVIGPIVVCGTVLDGVAAGNKGGASPGTEPLTSGGGAPGSGGVLVIGPIVVGGSASNPIPAAKTVAVPPPPGS